MEIKVFERVERKYSEPIVVATLTDGFQHTVTLKPFLYQPTELVYNDEGIESKKVACHIFHTVRFTVKREGVYRLSVTFKGGGETTETLVCKGFCGDGYVAVSKEDARYFAYSNGNPFYPVAINMAFPKKYPVTNKREFGVTEGFCYIGMRGYESWFRKCEKNGVNVVRVWLGHDYFTPDTGNADELELSQFSKIDKLLALAKKYRIKLKLTLEHFRKFSGEKNNTMPLFIKQLAIDGQECLTMKQWLTEERWKRAWLSKVEEFAKRYAGDTEIFAIELWNEMNAVDASYDEVLQWNRQMLPRVKALFPDNLVTNSLGSIDSYANVTRYETFPWELCDFKQMHRYLDQGAPLEKTTREPIELLDDGLNILWQNNMPLIVAETGAVNNCHCAEFKYYSNDDLGLILVDCVYTPVFLASASCGHMWHWDSRYIESKNLYRYYKPLSCLISGVDFASEHFECIDLSDDEVYLFILKGKSVCLGFLRNKNANWQNLLRDLKSPVTVLQKTVDFSAESVSAYPIWQEDTTAVTAAKGKLIFSNVLYGTVFKINNKQPAYD